MLKTNRFNIQVRAAHSNGSRSNIWKASTEAVRNISQEKMSNLSQKNDWIHMK